MPNEQAKDVVQDVLISLMESNLVLDLSKIRSWMYRVATRRYIDCYRRDQQYQTILQRDFFKEERVIEFDYPDFEPLYQAIQLLKHKERMVIDLYYFQEFTVKEISTILQLSQSNIKITLMRGRRHLKHLLEKEGYHYEDFI
ncbi:sigma-70, region 4 [Streptococcus ictaluri 707-05]|uniref:Sigma-70, region 4 n=1 Tax=Streptococcus ictaluri 707-05 TaxID=764299 RepID=G5K284_9STRE|nr:sigma-70, region 4 [Streptococcus ictaluri 707-05]